MIGTFGHILFQTSSSKILTFDEFTRKSSAVFAEHPVLDDKPTLQHVGDGLDTIEYSIRLDVSLGINPIIEIEKLRQIKSAGEEQKFIIGGKVIGDFVLIDLGEKWPSVDNRGNVLVALVSLILKEFV